MKVAIIGCSGRFPGANTIKEFIQNIYSNKNVLSTLSTRYSVNELKSATDLYHLPVGFIDDITGFDAKFFGIKDREALRISPQQRLLLESTYHVFANANYNLESIKNRPIGMFIGAVNDDYLEQVDFMSQDIDAFFHIGSDISMLAGRVSNYFKLTGPSQVICSACASAGVAIHQAIQSITNGDSEMAVAGGTYLVSLHRLMLHYRLGTLSKKGLCTPFADNADGMTLGEGVGLLLLKSYEAAIRDNDTIYAVIEASGINQEGGKGTTAQPTVESQSALIQATYEKYSIDPNNIAYIETHGTGTLIGDLVEFNALNKAFSSFTNQKQFCTIGTLKANIGHSVSASAALSLIKLIHVLRSRVAPPSSYYKQSRSEINLEESPFKILTETQELATNDKRPLMGAINAFGYVGTNVHIVVSIPTHQKHTPVPKAKKQTQEQILFYFSSKDWHSLQSYLIRFIDLLNDNNEPLISISSALMAQDHFDKKLIFIAKSKNELIKKLNGLITTLEEKEYSDNEYFALAKGHNELETEKVTSGNLKELIFRLLLGFKANNLMFSPKIEKEHLPDYPFHHEHFQLKSEFKEQFSSYNPVTIQSTPSQPSNIIEAHPSNSTETSMITSENPVLPILSKLLEVESGAINTKKTFQELGLDSVLSIELVTEINELLNMSLSPTIIYDYPSPYDLIELINANYSAELSPGQLDTPKEVSTPPELIQSVTPYGPQDIAIIGISCRFPKSKNINEFYQNLVNGVSVIDEIPANRWSIDTFFDTDLVKPWKMNTKWGGFIEDYDKFDAPFFNISPKEALEMDPQQRLLLEEFWHVLENAGYVPDKMPIDEIGTFTAAAHGDYVRHATRADYAPTGHLFTGNNLAILSARLAYFLNFKGPALNVDSACSTSLVATHLACASLIRGECKMAIVGAANIFSTEYNFLYYTKSGMLSPEGRCKVFDNDANGFVPGEGVAAVLLKPATEAIKDHDYIYAIIKASGINQDGKTNGITAPSEKSQRELQIELFKKTNINPETIGYVETHGTGTKLGDPIEVEALTHSFRQFTNSNQYCYLGAVKSNVGHTIMTAGLAGLIKATMTVNQHIIPPTLHVQTPNKFIDFNNSPFKLPLEKKRWERTGSTPRRALVNAFGMSGTNAQVILEEYNQEQGPLNSNYQLIVLSALDQEGLNNQVKNLRLYLRETSEINLLNLAYTLQVGRKHFPFKCVFIVNSIQLLDQLLDNYMMDKRNVDLVYENNKNTPSLSAAKRQQLTKEEGGRVDLLLDITNNWFADKEIVWSNLYEKQPFRIPLPGYPFKKIRYWIEAPEQIHEPSNPSVSLVTTETEQVVKHMIEETLGIVHTEVDPDISLVNLGMDSILGLTLQKKLEQALSIRIPTKDMFEHLTINRLTQYIHEVMRLSSETKTKQDTWTYGIGNNITPEFLKQESILPFKINLPEPKTTIKKHPKNYFITGSTGYLGAYLLAMLFEHTSAHVYALVRYATEEGFNKIKSNLERVNLWKESYNKRLTVITGDLEKTNFGMGEEDYIKLSQSIDCILHAGAKVNHILSYTDLKQVNVEGTIEIIKFAITGRIKPVHYISTIGTVIRRILTTGKTEVLTAEKTTENAIGIEVGYGQSKWVAEQLLWQAHEQGLPVSIYRAGEITGLSNKPQCRTDDMFHMLVECFSKMETYPKTWLGGVVDILPIDYVTTSIIKMMDSDYHHSGFYHLVHPHPCSTELVFDWLNQHHKPMRAVAYEDWRDQCIKYLQSNSDSSRNPVLLQIFRDTPFGYRFTWYFKDYGLQIKETQKVQKELGIKCPKLNETLFNNVFNYILEYK